MFRRREASGPLAALSPREQDVLARMAEGKSNQGIAEDLVLSLAAIEKHVTAIMRKLGIGPAETGNRRVLAVLAYLRDGQR
jgi:DNA-binding NarL/FixJ family response regulator